MSYIKKKVFLSDGQIAKLESALRKNEEITLQIDKSKSPNYEMYLAKTNINRINEGKRITISKTQLNKNGGFLPFLIPILTGAATGFGAWSAKKALDKISGSGNIKKKSKKWKRSVFTKGISDAMINENMIKEKGFRGVFTIDTLPKQMRKFENRIINFDISTGPGTHWICYYNDPKYKFVEYFDSFGEYEYEGIKLKEGDIPKNIENYIKTSKKEIGYNSSFLQQPTSVKCGLFCMKYISGRNKGKSPVEVLYSFTQEPSAYNWKLVNFS